MSQERSWPAGQVGMSGAASGHSNMASPRRGARIWRSVHRERPVNEPLGQAPALLLMQEGAHHVPCGSEYPPTGRSPRRGVARGTGVPGHGREGPRSPCTLTRNLVPPSKTGPRAAATYCAPRCQPPSSRPSSGSPSAYRLLPQHVGQHPRDDLAAFPAHRHRSRRQHGFLLDHDPRGPALDTAAPGGHGQPRLQRGGQHPARRRRPRHGRQLGHALQLGPVHRRLRPVHPGDRDLERPHPFWACPSSPCWS